MSEPVVKPLGRKAYGSIGHLPCSRMGPGDHAVDQGMAKICTEKVRDKHDVVIVQEKLDGSCCAVAMVDGILHPLGRAGWPAVSSKYYQHRMFHDWAMLNSERFFSVLKEGERIVGEWLAQAHGTRYTLGDRDPFVAFDIMRGEERTPYLEFRKRVEPVFRIPPQLSFGGPLSVELALQYAGDYGFYGAADQIEGVVYRVERKGEVDFLAKYVRPDKKDGCYLPEVSGQPEVWNWKGLIA